MENEKLLKELKPNFNFLYELFMPTGKKIKSSLMMFIVSIVITIIIYSSENLFIGHTENIFNNINFIDIVLFICYFLVVLSFIKLIFHTILQKIQYDHISYKFYESYMIYEDDFLNQHKKNIMYNNIKEVEIRRTILDRILGMGVIIIYTNAENKRNNGLVVYGLKNPKEDYDFLDKLINNSRNSDSISSNNQSYPIQNVKEVENKEPNISVNNETDENLENFQKEEIQKIKDEENFKESLKEVNNVENVNNS
jgi:membrane protein YdbS with pleckstrin-like domain